MRQIYNLYLEAWELFQAGEYVKAARKVNEADRKVLDLIEGGFSSPAEADEPLSSDELNRVESIRAAFAGATQREATAPPRGNPQWLLYALQIIQVVGPLVADFLRRRRPE